MIPSGISDVFFVRFFEEFLPAIPLSIPLEIPIATSRNYIKDFFYGFLFGFLADNVYDRPPLKSVELVNQKTIYTPYVFLNSLLKIILSNTFRSSILVYMPTSFRVVYPTLAKKTRLWRFQTSGKIPSFRHFAGVSTIGTFRPGSETGQALERVCPTLHLMTFASTSPAKLTGPLQCHGLCSDSKHLKQISGGS